MNAAALLLCVALAGPLDAPVLAADLQPHTLAAWQAYVAATEARIAREVADGRRFLSVDFAPGDRGVRVRASLRGGSLLVEEPAIPMVPSIEVQDGEVHHWRGGLFLPGVTLDQVIAELHRPAPPSEDVLASRVLADAPDAQRVYLRLLRRTLVTAVYDTEHDVRFVRHSPTRASTLSRSHRIAELEAPGTPQERALAPGHDRGFLWRLNAYSRFEQVEGGVLVEIESISLSRGVPMLARPLVAPIVASIARESMERTLDSLRRRLPAGGRAH